MKWILISAVALLLAPTSVQAAEADSKCGLDGCEPIDEACHDLEGRPCLAPVYGIDECSGLIAYECAWLDSWCYDLDGRTCTEILLRLIQADSASGSAQCEGPACDLVNAACQRAFGMDCVALEADAASCVGTPCDEINSICGGCLPSAESERAQVDCMGPGCDELNWVCETALEFHCVDGGSESTACVGTVCDLINEVCGGCVEATSSADARLDGFNCPRDLPHCQVLFLVCDITGSDLCTIVSV